MPCGHSAGGAARVPREQRRGRRAASGPSTGCGWRGAGRGAPRRRSMPRWCSCTCAWVQASVAARSNVAGSRCLSARSSDVLARLARRPSRRSTRAVAPGASRHATAQAEDRIEHRADGVRQRPAVDHRDRRCGSSRPRPRKRARSVSYWMPPPVSPSTTARWAAQTCRSSRERGRRVASEGADVRRRTRSARTAWRRPDARRRRPAAPARARRRT